MQNNRFLLVIGILVALMPFLGLPTSWKTVLYVILGLIVSVSAIYRVVATRRALSRHEHEAPAFVDNVTVIEEAEALLDEDEVV